MTPAHKHEIAPANDKRAQTDSITAGPSYCSPKPTYIPPPPSRLHLRFGLYYDFEKTTAWHVGLPP